MLHGYYIYLNTDGEQVAVTTVSSCSFGYFWPDVKAVGVVTEFIHAHKRDRHTHQSFHKVISFANDPFIRNHRCWSPRISNVWQSFLLWDTEGKRSPNPFFPVPDPVTIVLHEPPQLSSHLVVWLHAPP